MTTCQARTASRGTLRMQGGGLCPREARWVDPKGFVYCAQHSKDYPTIFRKAAQWAASVAFKTAKEREAFMSAFNGEAKRIDAK